jgi:hypothetical protein
MTTKFKNGKPIKVYRYNNAIDVALSNNQVKGVNMILDHIVKYQNSFTSSYLFTNNLLKIMNKGIDTNNLIGSAVFNCKFQFDEWPSTHSNLEKMITGYSGSLFDLRFKYKEIFPELAEQDVEEEEYGEVKQLQTITYHINLLPTLKDTDDGSNFMIATENRGEQELNLFTQ